jgi:hypothetical protein
MAPSKESKTTSTMPLPANLYASLEGIDGNPRTPAEFDMSPHEEGEFFFRADDDATEVCFFSIAISSTSTLPPFPQASKRSKFQL